MRPFFQSETAKQDWENNQAKKIFIMTNYLSLDYYLVLAAAIY